MSEVNMQKIIGETFEDMSIAEMSLVQGSGDVNALSSPLTISSIPCAEAASAIASAIGTVILSIIKC